MILSSFEPMTKARRLTWVKRVAARLSHQFTTRYIAGQASHGDIDLGNVSTATLLNEIERESLDILAYVKEIRRRIAKANDIDLRKCL